MQFALVNNERTFPAPGLSGICQGCGEPMKAKCGKIRVWHWSHISKKICDKWWERETEWHRGWKANFPEEWRECRMQDSETGEFHIADVLTSQKLVIELQHSAITFDEQKAREKFYKNMVWIVNGSRTDAGYSRFINGIKHLLPTEKNSVFVIKSPKKCFPAAWLSSNVPVFFDFSNADLEQADRGIHEFLWCLIPVQAEGWTIVLKFTKKLFLERATKYPKLFLRSLNQVVDEAEKYVREQKRRAYVEFDNSFLNSIKHKAGYWRG